MKLTFKPIVVALLACTYASAALAEEAAAPPPPANLLEAITTGKPMTNFRLRYEHVSQDGKTNDANAWTLRSLIGWQTRPFNNFSVGAQLINVSQLNNQFYDNTNTVFGNATPADKTNYPVVADPDYTDINQLFVEWSGLPDTKVRVGRQSVKLDNVRFIGNVEFRQVMQVFDGIALENKSIPNTELYFAHFFDVNQITTARRQGDIDIAHATWKFMPGESLTAYGYFEDMARNGQNIRSNAGVTSGTGLTDDSNRTLGLRLDGAYKVNDDWKVLHTAEYAKQNDYGNGNPLINAHYWRLGAGAGYGNWYLRLDRELLSSNNSLYGFQTPFGTNHLFQGWGDFFLVTPKQGMVDTFLSFGGKVYDIQLAGEYHWFDSDTNFRTNGNTPTNLTGSSYGRELDLSAAYTYNKNWMGKVEYFNYTADDCYTTSAAAGAYNCTNTSAGRAYRSTDKFLMTLMYTF